MFFSYSTGVPTSAGAGGASGRASPTASAEPGTSWEREGSFAGLPVGSPGWPCEGAAASGGAASAPASAAGVGASAASPFAPAAAGLLNSMDRTAPAGMLSSQRPPGDAACSAGASGAGASGSLGGHGLFLSR